MTWPLGASFAGGSSPQARGTVGAACRTNPGKRFIPAGAGNGHAVSPSRAATTVHPRRRGERSRITICGRWRGGSSPQARGTAMVRLPKAMSFRFIPAGAGNGPRSRPRPRSMPVHPRRRGERERVAETMVRLVGSSPQARGTAGLATPELVECRFIPAGAGNGCGPSLSREPEPVHPRRRGERGGMVGSNYNENGSSPQARGTGALGRWQIPRHRFIPAGAGNG